MSISIGALQGTVSLDDRFSGALDLVMHRTDQFLSKMDSGFGRLALGVAGVGGAIAAVAGTISYMGVQGSKLNDLDKSFERLAGSVSNANAIMDAMNKGVANTVDSTELLEFANRALGTGALKTAEQFATVTTAARAYSRDGLGPVQNILNSVSNALASGNTRQLRYITGTIDIKKAEEALAKQLGTTRDELSARQKQDAGRIAILETLQKKVESTGRLELSYAERVKAAMLAVGNWFDDINKRVAALPSVGRAFDTILSSISKTFGGNFTSLADLIVNFVDRFARGVEQYGPTVIEWAKQLLDWISDVLDYVRRGWDLVPDWIKRVGTEAAATGIALKLVGGAAGTTGEALIGLGGSVGGSISGFKDLLSLTHDLYDSMRALGKAGLWSEILGWLTQIGVSAASLGAGLGALASFGAVAFVSQGVLGGKGSTLKDDVRRSLYGPDKPKPWNVIGDLNVMGVGPNASGFVQGGTPDLRDPGEVAEASAKMTKEAADKAKAYWDDYFQFVDRRTVDEQQQRENAVNRWYAHEREALDKLKLAHKEYTNALAALDSVRAEKIVDIYNPVTNLQPRQLSPVPFLPTLGAGILEPSTRPLPNIPYMRTGTESFSKTFAASFKELPTLLIDSFTGSGDWKGGVKALGVTFSNNLFGDKGLWAGATAKLSGAIGGGLSKVLGGTMGKALGAGIGAMLPGIGALIAPLAQAAIGGLKKLMGGPSAEELAGRKLVSQFEDTLAKSLTGIQRAEAGTDKWKQTTIGVRDMFLKAGLSVEDARAATERLWAASKQGEDAVKAVIEQINMTKELAQARKDLKATEKQLAGQQLQNASAILAMIKGQQDGVALTGRELKDFGAIAVASFGAALKAGMSFAEALQQVGPGLADLQDALQRAGVASDDAFVGILARLGKIQQQNPTLVAGIGALGDSFVALNAMGRLTPATFESIERSGSSLYERLQAEVAGLGGSTEDALTLMQDYLHKAEKSARDLGIPLDANTQMLIDQSKELGIWQEAGKTATDILIDQMNELVDKIQDLVDAILGVPNINVGVNYNDPGAPGADPAPGGQNGLQPRYLNAGLVRMTPRGADIYPAMIRADERVLTPNQYRDTVAESFGRGMAAGGGANGETFIENVITIGDEVLARQIRKIQDRDVRMRRKVRGA